MKKYNMARLNKRVTFCNVKSVENNNTGSYIPYPVPFLTLWYGSYTQTLEQTYTIQGNQSTASITIAIRHNAALEDRYEKGGALYAQIGERNYEVIQYNGDDDINAYDLVTLKHVKKIG